jgi:hypothetical protein
MPGTQELLPPQLNRRWRKLEAKIRRHREHLTGQGALASWSVCGRRVWAVRYYVRTADRKVQKSIYVGSDTELIQRTQELLYELRHPAVVLAEVQALMRLSRLLMRVIRRRAGTRRRSRIHSLGPRPGRSAGKPSGGHLATRRLSNLKTGPTKRLFPVVEPQS